MSIDFTLTPELEEIRLRVRAFINDVVKPGEARIGDPDEILDRNPHDVVMWEADSSLGRHLLEDPAYEVVYRDDQAVVACRLGSSFC